MEFLLSVDLIKATTYLGATSVERHSQFINHTSNDDAPAPTTGHWTRPTLHEHHIIRQTRFRMTFG